MAQRENPFYGKTIKEIARICHVDLTTARRWKRGARRPNQMALLLIAADLGMFAPEWAGWRIRGNCLYSPEGWEIAVNMVIALPLLKQRIAAYESEIRRLKSEVVSIQEQPLPDVWPEWVFDQLG